MRDLVTWALLQMQRLQLLTKHAKAHGLPVEAGAADSESDDESGGQQLVGLKAAHERLKSIQQLCGSSPGRSPNGVLTPNRCACMTAQS